MKKKNILTAALSLSLVGVIAVGGTLAYFTDQSETKTNAFTTGKVDIVLHDMSPEVDGMVSGTEKPEGGIEYDNIVPGDELSKDVFVSVVHDSAPTRLAVLVTVKNNTGTEKPTDEELLSRVDNAILREGKFSINTTYYAEDFEDLTGTLYIMDGIVDTSDKNQIIDLFSSIQIPSEWNNDYADASFDINVTAYAAQADHMTAEEFEQMALEQAKGTGEHFEADYGSIN